MHNMLSPYRPMPPRHRVLSTGMPELDAALAVGGFPRSFLTDIVAHRTPMPLARQLLFRAIAHQQREGHIAAWVDVPGALHLAEAAAHGVRNAELLVTQPETDTHFTDVAKALVRSGAVDLLVIDGSDDIPWPSPFASMHFFQRFFAQLRASGTAVVLLRPQREGPPAQALPGNSSPRYLSSLRCEVLAVDAPPEAASGPAALVRVLKNQFALPFTEARVSLAPQPVQP